MVESGPWATRWRGWVLGTMAALLGTIAAWRWPIETAASWVVFGVLVAPLLAPIVGIAKAKRYTYKWATLCVTPYFIVGLTETVANPARRAWSAAVLILALCWFVGLVAFLRATRIKN